MRIMLFVLAVLLLTVLASGCGPKEHTEDGALIEGRVADAVDATPVDSARVLLRAFSWWGELYQEEQLTDANGRFLFPVVSNRHVHILEVTKDGYVAVTLREEGGGYLDIALERAESPIPLDMLRN